MRIKLHHSSVVLLLCILYIVVSPLNTILPVSLNRVVTLLFLFSETWYAFKGGVTRRWVFYVSFWVMIGVFACLRGPVLSENISDMVYLFSSFYLLQIMTNDRLLSGMAHDVCSNRKKILYAVTIAYLLIGISALFPASFEENGAFKGFMYNSHSMASTSVLITSVVELCLFTDKKKRKRLFHYEAVLMLIGGVIVLASKSRTFLVPEAVLVWNYLIHLPIKKSQVRLFAAVIFSGVIFLLRNEILEKFREAMANQYARDALAAFTNFRSVLWKCDLTYFKNENFIWKLFGNGFSFVRDLHERELSTRLWSHNDLTYLLLASGVTGLFIYLETVFYTARKVCRKKSQFLWFAAFVLFPMCFNGFYIYTPLIWAYLIFRLAYFTEEKHLA